MALTLEIFIHMDSGPRETWTVHEDEVPLSEIGWRQAERMADELAAGGPIAAVYGTPALRCRQSVEPLAKKLGLSVQVSKGFHNTAGAKAPDGWARPDRTGPDPIGSCFYAGRAVSALDEIQAATPNGRVVIASHGDVVPLFLAAMAGRGGAAMPARVEGRGGLYTVTVDGNKVSLTSRNPSADFPG